MDEYGFGSEMRLPIKEFIVYQRRLNVQNCVIAIFARLESYHDIVF